MSELIEGLVISHLGQGIAVQYNDTIILCQPRRKLETVAVGDRVSWRLSSPDQGSIEEILPRRSLLIRSSSNGKIRPVAANIDRVFVVVAVEPFCDFLLIDQYLAVCENRGIDAAIILNKIDLALPEALLAELDIYNRLGYPFYTVSTYDHRGLDVLNSALKDQTSILAGQSGVGKSSLTKTLIPDLDLKTKTLSETTRHGRHTTTAATLYHLPCGGDLIDSPGVAIFGLAGLTERHLAYGFRDFQPFIDQCQFNDCRHDKDKGCAIRVAVENGDISASRYQRFLKLREKMTLA